MNRTAAAGIALALVASLFAATDATALDPYRVCMHVPVTGAAPLPHHPSRFGGFYFDMVNAEQGGIDGHPVAFSAYDDGFSPAGARRAVETCRRDGAHLMVGPYGVDQIVSVSRWAERQEMPYLHGSVPERSLDPGLTWSAAIGATDEDQMRMLADSLASSFDDETNLGLIWIDSPYYEAGRQALIDALAAHDRDLTVDVPVQKDEQQFQSAFYQLESQQVKAVVLYLTPNVALKMLNQKPPTYRPTWLAPNVGLENDFIATAARGQPFYVLSDPNPVYDPDDPSLPWYDEILEFHRVFDTYSPEQDPPRDAADWTAYLRAKQIHRFLDALDGDVSPGAIQASFSTYAESPAGAFPTCALDFTVRARFGSRAWHVDALEGDEWEPFRHCTDGLAEDLTPPEITCNGPLLVTEELRCSIADDGAGIGAYQIEAQGLTGAASTSGDGGCAARAEPELTLPPDVHRVEVTAANCDGVGANRGMTVLSL